jgi:hypothetical protein
LIERTEPIPLLEGEIEQIARLWHTSPDGARDLWRTQNKLCKHYEDDTYLVKAFPMATMTHLMVRRKDGKAIHSWPDLQAIKNELAGPEWEGAELYPAESRKYDTSNTYHLWCTKTPFPFGYRL